MASIAFPGASHSIDLPNGTKYGFVHYKPSTKYPYLLFLHGFPSSSYDWRYQIPFFARQGYGIIAPDLLGYGDTDKPMDPHAYKLKKMSEEMIALLNALGVKKVIGISHDWGSGLLSRLGNYYSSRILAFIFLDVGYQVPTSHFSLDDVNEMMQQILGYLTFGYWNFFNSPDAAALMDRDPARTDALIYPNDPQLWRYNLAPIGAARTWFEESKMGPIASWMAAEAIAIHNQIFAVNNGGYRPALNWYKAYIANLNSEDEASLPSERLQLEQPTLLITCSRDVVIVPAMQEQITREHVKDLQVKEVDTGHWVQLEKPDEVNQIIKAFVEGLEAAS